MQVPAAPADAELKAVIDKLASFVAKNGEGFEALTRTKQADNPKFNFLNGGESYDYYRYKVWEAMQAQQYGGHDSAAPGAHSQPITYEPIPQQQQQQQQQQQHTQPLAQHPPPQPFGEAPQYYSGPPPVQPSPQGPNDYNKTNPTHGSTDASGTNGREGDTGDPQPQPQPQPPTQAHKKTLMPTPLFAPPQPLAFGELDGLVNMARGEPIPTHLRAVSAWVYEHANLSPETVQAFCGYYMNKVGAVVGVTTMYIERQPLLLVLQDVMFQGLEFGATGMLGSLAQLVAPCAHKILSGQRVEDMQHVVQTIQYWGGQGLFNPQMTADMVRDVESVFASHTPILPVAYTAPPPPQAMNAHPQSLKYYELPAGLMRASLKMTDRPYLAIDPKYLRLTQPVMTPELAEAVAHFYRPNDDITDHEGWVMSALKPFYREREEGIREANGEAMTPKRSRKDKRDRHDDHRDNYRRRSRSRSRGRSRERSRRKRYSSSSSSSSYSGSGSSRSSSRSSRSSSGSSRSRSLSPRRSQGRDHSPRRDSEDRRRSRSRSREVDRHRSVTTRDTEPETGGLGIGATKVPTAQTPLGNSNVGFKMLQKMGWAGAGLGANQDGMAVPVSALIKQRDVRDKFQGLGGGDAETPPNADGSAFDDFRKKRSNKYFQSMEGKGANKSTKKCNKCGKTDHLARDCNSIGVIQ